MKVMVCVSNRLGGSKPAALAQRFGMIPVSTEDFAGMLSLEELEEVRRSGVTYSVNWRVATCNIDGHVITTDY